MKRTLALLLALLMLLPLYACGTETKETKTAENQQTAKDTEAVDNTTIRLKALTGPTGMGLATLIHNDKEGAGNKADYELELVSTPDQITGPVLGNLCDIAAVPINLASTLYQKTGGKVQIICANTLGVLYMVENGNAIESVKDLKGKTIYAPNPGSTPEYVLRYVLKENGIDPDKDVKLEFVAGGDDVAAKLAADKNAIGMLPEPKKSAFLAQNSDYRVCLDMTEEWNKVAGEGNTLVQGVFIARTEFIKEHPQAIKNFLDDYNASQENVNTAENGAALVVETGILPNEGLAKKAIPGCNITFIEGKEMKAAVQKCLQVLYEANPQSVGGKLPADDIYYAR